jgi:hypothetical protein
MNTTEDDDDDTLTPENLQMLKALLIEQLGPIFDKLMQSLDQTERALPGRQAEPGDVRSGSDTSSRPLH